MFSVPTNFDYQLLSQIKKCDIYEIYGKLTNDVIGSCRPTVLLPAVNKQKLENEILTAHNYGYKFNYIANSSCLGNIEYTKNGLKEIKKLFGYLSDFNVDSITVTIPFLAQYIKSNFPKLKIHISTLAGVDNLRKFESWQDLGVSCITLAISANRDFDFLKKIAVIKKCQVKLVVNQACDYQCIYYNYHANINSHQSSKKYQLPLEFCSFQCKYLRTLNPEILLRAPWIRPEDLHIYKKLGYNLFKLVQRQDPTEKIVRIVKAYQQEGYRGNLLDIMNFVYNIDKNRIGNIKNNLSRYFLYFFKPFKVNIINLFKIYNLLGDDYSLYIDNKKLDKFINRFLEQSCNNCSDCNYCRRWAAKAVSFDKTKQAKLLKNYQEIMKIIS